MTEIFCFLQLYLMYDIENITIVENTAYNPNKFSFSNEIYSIRWTLVHLNCMHSIQFICYVLYAFENCSHSEFICCELSGWECESFYQHLRGVLKRKWKVQSVYIEWSNMKIIFGLLRFKCYGISCLFIGSKIFGLYNNAI